MFLSDQLDNSEDAVEFECNRWLDVKEDDGLIVRELIAGGAQMLNSKCQPKVAIRNVLLCFKYMLKYNCHLCIFQQPRTIHR